MMVRRLVPLLALLAWTIAASAQAAPPRPELLLDPAFRARAREVLSPLPTTRNLGRQAAAGAAPGFLPPDKNVPTVTDHFTPVALLVDFPDRGHNPPELPPGAPNHAYHDPSAYADILFGPTYLTVRSYFDEVSYGRFTVQGDATSVSDWQTLDNLSSVYLGTDQGIAESSQLVADAVAAHDGTVDFTRFDNDGPDGIPDSGDDDGYVDALMVVHTEWGWEDSGLAENFASHYRALGAPITTADIGFDGNPIRIADYIVVPEESFKLDVVINGEDPPIQNGNEPMVEIGVWCHELGHILGLPDLYDTTFQSWGLGNYGLMAYGLWGPNYDAGASPEANRNANQPAHLSAWAKKELEWLSPTPVWTDGSGGAGETKHLDPVETPIIHTGNDLALQLFARSDGTEYFLVEHRMSKLFDFGFTDQNHGALLIWHVDENVLASGGSTPNNNRFWKGVDVECADGQDSNGLDDLDLRVNFYEFDDFYAIEATASGSSTSFGPATNPDSNTNLGLPTGVLVEPQDTVSTSPLTQFNVTVFAGSIVLDPASFTATSIVPDTIDLTWTPSPATDVAGYRVYHTPTGGPETSEDVGALFAHSITGLAENRYSVFVAAYDADGNESAGQPQSVVVDFTDPVGAASPPGAVYDTTVTVTLTAIDTADPTPTIRTCTGSGCTPADEYTTPLTFTTDTVLRYQAVDWAGNTSAVGEETYTISRTSSGGGGGGGCFLESLGENRSP